MLEAKDETFRLELDCLSEVVLPLVAVDADVLIEELDCLDVDFVDLEGECELLVLFDTDVAELNVIDFVDVRVDVDE